MYSPRNEVGFRYIWSKLNYMRANTALRLTSINTKLSMQDGNGVRAYWRDLSFFNGLQKSKEYIGLSARHSFRGNKIIGGNFNMRSPSSGWQRKTKSSFRFNSQTDLSFSLSRLRTQIVFVEQQFMDW